MTTSDERTHPLIEYLLSRKEERSVLAALRRGLGQPIGAVPEMFPYVVPFVERGAGEWAEHSLYTIASLFALHPAHINRGNLGTHLRQLTVQLNDEQSTERRLQHLLRAEPDMLPDLLRQMVSLLKSKDIPINWHRLLFDVRSWDDPDRRRRTARFWANEFWQA